MTLLMLSLAMSARTPVFMWVVAMGCDTVLIATFMILKAMGKL